MISTMSRNLDSAELRVEEAVFQGQIPWLSWQIPVKFYRGKPCNTLYGGYTPHNMSRDRSKHNVIITLERDAERAGRVSGDKGEVETGKREGARKEEGERQERKAGEREEARKEEGREERKA